VPVIRAAAVAELAQSIVVAQTEHQFGEDFRLAFVQMIELVEFVRRKVQCVGLDPDHAAATSASSARWCCRAARNVVGCTQPIS